MSHTPGPWTHRPIKPHSIKNSIVEIDGGAPPERWVVWRVYRDEQGRRCHRPVGEAFLVGSEWAEGEANANLIAAAPEMLPFVERAAADGDETARALLARIRGEAG